MSAAAIYPSEESANQRARYARNIHVAVSAIFSLLIAVVLIFQRGIRFDLGVGLLTLVALVSFLGIWLGKRGKSDLSILLLIGALIVLTFGRVFVQKGLSIPTGIANIILTTTIALYTLPSIWQGRVVGVSFLATLAAVWMDQFTPKNVPTAAASEVGIRIALTLGVVYLIILARQLPRFNLRTKLILGFLLLSTVPLVLLGWQTYSSSQKILQQEVEAGLRENATSVSASFADFLNERVSSLVAEASLNDVQAFLQLTADEQIKNAIERQHALDALRVFASKDGDYALSYALIDSSGRNVLDTLPTNINTVQQDANFFTEPFSKQLPFVSGVQFLRKFSNPALYISVPVFDQNNKVIGVLLATYNANLLQPLLQAAVENRSSGTEYTYLLDDGYFVVLAHSNKPDLIHKSLLNLDDTLLASSQNRALLPPGNREDLLIVQGEVTGNLQNMGAQTQFEAPSWEYDAAAAKYAAARVPNTSWIVITAQPVNAIIELTQTQTQNTVTSSIAISIAAALIALIASNYFTAPILDLTRVAQNLASGDFSQRAQTRAADEIGVLGQTFNVMSEQIQSLIGGLEQRVEERTSELESATRQSEKRARDLQIITEIARYISTEKDMEELLRLVTRTVSEQFGFYHVGIFLLNETQKFALLRAANSAGGQRMLEKQHRLEVGQTGIVGNVTATGAPRIALDTGSDAVFFNNPDLPETHSEMALPLTARGEIIGALDVQSREVNAFTASDISVLSLLADQIAIAIDNARLLEESKRALAAAQASFHEYVTEAWQTRGNAQVIGYYQTVTGGKPVLSQTAPEVEAALAKETSLLDVPIRLRGETIGALNIRAREESALTNEQISIIQSVTERLGLALENARLFEETSTRALREKKVTEITTRIRSVNDPQQMIQIAMEELKRTLGVSRVELLPKQPPSAPKDQ